MQVPKADLLDRFVITKLKKERLPNSDKLKDQFKLYKTEVETILAGASKDEMDLANDFLNELYTINGKIWDLERQLRSGLEDSLPLSEIGRRAIKIRNLNGMRVRVKNKICVLFGENVFEEVKVDHISEDNIGESLA